MGRFQKPTCKPLTHNTHDKQSFRVRKEYAQPHFWSAEDYDSDHNF